jgi:hypothetical protein
MASVVDDDLKLKESPQDEVFLPVNDEAKKDKQTEDTRDVVGGEDDKTLDDNAQQLTTPTLEAAAKQLQKEVRFY